MKKLFLALILIFCCTITTLASLTFAVDGDRIAYNSATLGSITDGTIMMRVYLTDATARQLLLSHIGEGYEIAYRGDVANDPFQASRHRATTYIESAANAASFAAYGTNKWLFVAFTWNTSGASTDQKLLIGDAVLGAAEPSAYTSQLLGAGTPGTTNADVYIGNGVVTSRELHGRVNWAAVYNRSMINLEIIQQQFYEFPAPGCVLFTYPGSNGTGTQIDYSGNVNNGTITGTLAISDNPTFGRMFR